MALIDDIISYWKLDESSGTDADDAHGANDGTTHNMEDPEDWVTGKIGKALNFGGTNEYLDIGTMGSMGSNLDNGFSISFWIKTNTSNKKAVTGVFNELDNVGLLIYINADKSESADTGKVMLMTRDADNNYLTFGTTNDINFRDGNWHHLVFTADGPNNLGAIYLDGSSVPISYQSQQTPDNFTDFEFPLVLGARNVRGALSFYLVATLDEPGIWNKILDSTDASNLWNDSDGFSYPFAGETHGQTISETLNLTDEINIHGILTKGKSISETLTLTDSISISKTVGTHGQTISETLNLTDTVSISRIAPGLVVGTNCGLVETAPSVDPGEESTYTMDSYGRAVRIIVGATPIIITEIGWWCDDATEESNFEVGIYSDDADVPGSLLEVDRTNAKETTAGWKKHSGLSWNLSANTTYWLAIQLDNTATPTSIDQESIGGQRYSYNASMSTLPDTWSATGTTDNYMMAIYGVYEEVEIHGVSVSDTATLTDTFSISKTGAYGISISDAATLSDTFSIYRIPQTFGISISDTATLTDTFSIYRVPQTFGISKSETLTLTDSINIAIEVPIPIGQIDKDTMWINNFGLWVEFPYFDYFKINKKQNQMSEFEVQLYDVSTAQKDYFKEQVECLFFCGETMVLKGRIQTIEYKSAYEVLAQGYGMEVKLLDKQFIVSGENRIQYDNQSAKDIITTINSNILTTTSGIFSTDYGNISMRYEYANRLNALGKTADAIDYYWWVSQTDSDNYSDNYLNVASNQGSTSSVKTFDLTNNATLIEQNRDTTNLVNYVSALGYGDGINQLDTYVYAASTQSSFLSANISATDSTISCSSIPFNATGSVRIAKEVVNYAGTSSTALTGCTRGTSSTTASAHNKMCYIEQYYPTSSAQTGSSIQIYGLMDYTLIDKTIINEETLEVIASGYLSDRKSPIQVIKISSDEPLIDAQLSIGDNTTITSSEANINGSYRIVSQEFKDNYGTLEMDTEVSNRSLEFIEQMQKSKEESESMSKYMQGATNIYAISEAENCDASHYLNLRFFIPNEAVAINKILLNFQMEDFRAYETANENESSHTHGISIENEPASGDHFVMSFYNNQMYSAYGATGGTKTSDTGSAHTHGITYGITEETLSSPSVDLYTGEDGGSMTLKDTYTTDQTEIDLTSEVSNIGAGSWINFQFRPNKNMRIEANTYIQIFIRSE